MAELDLQEMTKRHAALIEAKQSAEGSLSAECSMWSISAGATAIVVGFVGISDVYLQRMKEIGIDVGAQIKCLNQPPFSAPRQFQICDGVFSLDKEIATAIQISFA